MRRKGWKVSVYHKDQTPLLPLSETRKVVRKPTNPFEMVVNGEVHVLKDIITERNSGNDV